MKTTTTTPALTDANGYLTAAGRAEEARHIRKALSDDAVNAISDYEQILAGILCYSPANDGNGSIAFPGFDAALVHALKVATKASRAELKAVKGQWALRKVIAARRAVPKATK